MTSESINKNAIINAEKELLDSIKKSDVQKLSTLLHDDLLFIIPNGQTITKARDLEAYRSGNMKIESITSSQQEINLIADNAVVSVVIDMKGMFFNQPFDGRYKFIRVWKSFGADLKVIAGSSIQVQEVAS